jgi:hypothetical protein
VKTPGFRNFAITWKSFDIFVGSDHEDGAALFRTAGINFKADKP